MEKRFDATLKSLLEDDPPDWPRLLGIHDPRVRVIDSDISTISGAADKVLRLHGPPPTILRLEFQSGPDASLPVSLNVYNSVLERRHGLPVRSVLILLAPRADLAVLAGDYRQSLPGAAEPYRTFRYEVLRVWTLPVEPLLKGGLSTLPLAPISAVSAAELPGVLNHVKRRLAKHADRGQAGRLWTAIYVLLGLRYEQALVKQLLEGVMALEESTTYQAIVAKGRIQEARKMLRTQGEEQCGTRPPAWAVRALEQIESLEELEALGKRVLRVHSWEDLLPRPQKGTKRTRT
jgi:predicted transposase YdaD